MRQVSLVLLLLLFGSVFFAQDSSETPIDIEPWVCPEGFEGQTLNVFNWSTYIAENTIPDFEAACGVEVNYDIYDSAEEMQARIRQGNPGYDIVFPVAQQIESMINEELIIPIDLEKIPNIANIDKNVLNQPNDPGNQYTVPYLLSTIGVAYNTEAIPEGITSWEQVWNYDGKVAWIADLRSMIGVALMLQGLDPNTEDPEEIMMARDYLLERSGNVVIIAEDDGQTILERGDVDIAIEYSGDVFQIIDECACDTYAYVIPEEGTHFESDAVAIPVDAPNPELAMVFMDYLLHPQTAADIANYTAYGSPNRVARESGLIDAELFENPGIYPLPETFEKLFVLNSVSPEAEQAYNDAWDELLILIGN